MTMTRRDLLKTLAVSAAAAPFLGGKAFAAGSSALPDVVVGAAQPMTGVFAFAGIQMDAGIRDYCAWRSENGGILGRKMRYVAEVVGFKVDQAVPIFKKLMAEVKPSFFYCSGTPCVRAINQDVVQTGSVITTSTSCAQLLTDTSQFPQHFLSAPTYQVQHEILMEYIAKQGSGGSKPSVALVYSDTEFGRDGIPGSKARAEKLGIPVVLEISTKQGGVGTEVAPEVARLRRAKPDYVIFQGYVTSPIPEFVRQMREAGMKSKVAGTIWSMDYPTYTALANMNEQWMGVLPYRYAYESEAKQSTAIANIRAYVAKNRPDVKDISVFYVGSWFSGMAFAEIAERTLKAKKELTLGNMRATMESIRGWDAGGVMGVPVDLSGHQAPSGRVYQYSPSTRRMEPVSDWIRS